MVMKKVFLASAAIAMAMLVSVPAGAAEYVTILLEKVVNRTPDQTWAKIGPYCSIAQWLSAPCVITAGNGVSVGTNRRLRGTTDEIIVAATPYSYTYTQPATTILYHGTLAVEPLDRGRQTRIVYTLFYDQAPLGTDQAKAENRAMRAKRFSEALDAMKAMAESP
jgi:Polyketide cyclase / dehydrase and lipid transport